MEAEVFLGPGIMLVVGSFFSAEFPDEIIFIERPCAFRQSKQGQCRWPLSGFGRTARRISMTINVLKIIYEMTIIIEKHKIMSYI
jgi:hypothetical protein